MITSPDSRLRLEADGAVAVLTIDRQEKLNALDAAMVEALGELCRAIERDQTVRVLILTGAGAKSFCAGGDIESWSGSDAFTFGKRWVREGHDVFSRLTQLRQPVIAVLNGHALGGGLELAACADYRIGEAHVRIGQPETGLGVIPGWSGTQRAVRRFGPGVVRRMALFGEVFDGEVALRLGLVDRIVATGAGLAEAKLLAAQLLKRAPHAGEVTKMLINAAEDEEHERVLEALGGIAVATSPELAEGLAAFRGKRPAKF